MWILLPRASATAVRWEFLIDMSKSCIAKMTAKKSETHVMNLDDLARRHPWPHDKSCLRHGSGSWELHCFFRGTHRSIFEVQTDWCGFTCSNWSCSCDSHFWFYQITSDCHQIAASLCKSACFKPICSKCLSCWNENLILKCPCGCHDSWGLWSQGFETAIQMSALPTVMRLESSRSSPTWTFLVQQLFANKPTGGKHLYTVTTYNCLTISV